MRRLRRTVQTQWAAEVARRELDQPHPLRLRWRAAPPEFRSAATVGAPPCGQLLNDPDDCRPPAAVLAEAFAAHPARRLVILAEPGAGKTTLAALLVLAVLAMSGADDPIPVLIPMGGWDTAVPIDDWLGDRLFTDYPQAFRRRDDVRRTLADHRVMPVLDGLDELPESWRPRALRQIDAVAGTGPRMVITCRNAEFRAAVDHAGVLTRAAVIAIDPVCPADTIRYLTQREAVGSRRWRPVIAALRSEPQGPLAAALATPLMISLCRQVFRGAADRPELLTAMPSRAAIEHHLLQRFLPSIYSDSKDAAKAERGLAFLARHLSRRLDTTTLAWWQIAGAAPPWVLASLCGFLGGLLPLALFAGYVVYPNGFKVLDAAWLPPDLLPIVWLPIVVVVGANTRRMQASTVPGGLTRVLATLLLRALRDAGSVMLVAGVFVWVGALADPAPSYTWDIRSPLALALALLVEMVQQDQYYILITVAAAVVLSIGSGAMTLGRACLPRRFAERRGPLVPQLAHGLAVGSAAGAVMGLAAAVVNGPGELHLAVITGIGLTIGIGVPVGLTRWLQTPAGGEEPSSPASSLRADRRATLAVASIASVTMGVVLVFFAVADDVHDGEWIHGWHAVRAASLSVAMMLPVAAFASGSSWLTFAVARTWLALTRRLPWRLMGFLEDAHRRGVLRQAGTTYQFRHARLQDELATRPPDRPGNRPVGVPDPPPGRRTSEHVWSIAIFLLGVAAVLLSNTGT